MSKILIDEDTVKLALEALEVATTPFARDRQEVLRAQAALREALAEQPAQQTPVAWPCLIAEAWERYKTEMNK